MNAPANGSPEHQKRIEGVLAALRRAKRRAEDLAIATGTELVESDGVNVVLVTPAELVARRDKSAAKE
jgi:hypothetical protein